MTEIENLKAICPKCKIEEEFQRADRGFSLVGTYQCPVCREKYQEFQLTGEDYTSFLRRKINEVKTK